MFEPWDDPSLTGAAWIAARRATLARLTEGLFAPAAVEDDDDLWDDELTDAELAALASGGSPDDFAAPAQRLDRPMRDEGSEGTADAAVPGVDEPRAAQSADAVTDGAESDGLESDVDVS